VVLRDVANVQQEPLGFDSLEHEVSAPLDRLQRPVIIVPPLHACTHTHCTSNKQRGALRTVEVSMLPSAAGCSYHRCNLMPRMAAVSALPRVPGKHAFGGVAKRESLFVLPQTLECEQHGCHFIRRHCHRAEQDTQSPRTERRTKGRARQRRCSPCLLSTCVWPSRGGQWSTPSAA
jgi:hypothetical protein